MTQVIAWQYVAKPSDPYLFCDNDVMEGQKDVLAVVESVHPFLPLGKTLEESIAPMSPGSAQATGRSSSKRIASGSRGLLR